MAPVVLRAEISLSHEDFRRVVRGVRGEALQQQHPSPAEPIMNLWFRLCRAGGGADVSHESATTGDRLFGDFSVIAWRARSPRTF